MKNKVFRARWFAPLALGLGLVCWALGPAGRAGAAAGATPKPGAGSGRQASGSRERPMPDTLLARVANAREVTLSGFHTAWRQVGPPDRPDSLTPGNARKFLDLLIDKEALGEIALAERWVWTERESADYQATRDAMTMRVVLDSVLSSTRARMARAGIAGTDTLGNIPLGIAARESCAVALGVRFDEPLLERLTRAFAAVPRPSSDSTMMAQLRMLNVMPEIDSTLLPSPIVQVRTGPHTGPYSVGEVMAIWKALNPVYRPRVEDSADLRDIIENQLFERELRTEVGRRGIAGWRPIAATLARKREYFAVSHLVAREVYARIAMDSLTLYRYYQANRSDWDLPFRVTIARFVLATEVSARSMAHELLDAARAESLLALGGRAGARYLMEVSAESDSALFGRAMRAGPGSVVGPHPAENGFEVFRVLAVNPARSRTFQECRKLVGQRWYGVEGERLMVELMARCRGRTRVAVNEKALARLTSP